MYNGLLILNESNDTGDADLSFQFKYHQTKSPGLFPYVGDEQHSQAVSKQKCKFEAKLLSGH